MEHLPRVCLVSNLPNNPARSALSSHIIGGETGSGREHYTVCCRGLRSLIKGQLTHSFSYFMASCPRDATHCPSPCPHPSQALPERVLGQVLEVLASQEQVPPPRHAACGPVVRLCSPVIQALRIVTA